MSRFLLVVLAALPSALVALAAAGPARADFVVPGSANPNLAGRSADYTCCSGDAVPGQAPVEVPDVEIGSCASLEILASGRVSFTPVVADGNNPDGDDAFSMTNYGDGISAPLNVRANALIGVFLGDDSPTGAPTPGQLDFNDALGAVAFDPAIGQIFFIGDGLNTDTKAGQFDGAPQTFVVPPGATRLFLGTADGSGWYNNSGSFTVDVSSTPETRERGCGDPANPPGVVSSDALLVLRAAVGSQPCDDCVCDVDRSGFVVSSDALAVLRHAVGQDVPLRCGCCPAAV